MIKSIIKSPHFHVLMVWAGASYLHWLDGTEHLMINIIALGVVFGLIHTSIMCLMAEIREMDKD